MTSFPDFDRALEARLVAYCAIDSQSDETSPSQPSTAIQLDMQRHLVAELERIGASEIELTDYGVVLATVPATAQNAPSIGFCAHVDTAPQYNATGVKPRVHHAWDGNDITYPDVPDLVLSGSYSSYLAGKVGEDIVTASGLTLLGADDKSGVAVIMTMTEHLLSTPGLKHGKIRLAFTPDEEIGRGVAPRLPVDFGVDFAYTLDGSSFGKIEYESFSADGASVSIKGVSAHPGYAKDKLVNALHVAARIVSLLDVAGETPETTSDREGFIHCYGIQGGSSEADVRFILRDFELDGLSARRDKLQKACTTAMEDFPGADVVCEFAKQYRNMRYWLENDMTPVELAHAACKEEGVASLTGLIRGGTDGSRLTELGIPCPNLFTGMQEIHGPLEWISVQDMAVATRVCLRLVHRAAVS
ncbi:tripeptide aminopeptidase [Shimia gijangensis]|uniref:Peptidase T n=1 Tax=Shimia gijangensis TaxID=1470563 RepID=A0A1M6HWU4_9RHOB|nr:peptidase T [Shimia gijangensis]SHJ26661.1 tripeptide aminopeptidase [Shimia gijangensis]